MAYGIRFYTILGSKISSTSIRPDENNVSFNTLVRSPKDAKAGNLESRETKTSPFAIRAKKHTNRIKYHINL